MPDQRPNIIIITTDQQRTDSLSCYGSTFTHTPHLDRLAAEGVLFERAYCTNPVCTPSRASLFSGRMVSSHGAWNVGTAVALDEVLISHRLGAVGYRTHYVGKAHFQPFGLAPADSFAAEMRTESRQGWEELYPQFRGPYYGFETVELALGHTTFGIAGHYGAWVKEQATEAEFAAWSTAESRGGYSYGCEAKDWDLPLRLHNSVWTAERSIDFLEHLDAEQPFLLAIGFEDPHHPHALPRDWPDRLDPAAVPLPAYSEGELQDKPPHFLEAHRGELESSEIRGDFWVAGQGVGADYSSVTPEQARLGRAYYYDMVRLIDAQMGRILECLERRGLSENTLVLFTTDHGELLGDHGIWMKGPFHYEPLVRVPMIARWPRGFSGGRRMDGLFSLADIVPTCLTAAGLLPAPEIDGVDAMSLLTGEANSVRDYAIVECIDDPAKLRLKTIVTEDRKLTWYCGHDYGELYDLASDPGEIVNRWNDAAYAADKARLMGALLGEMERLEQRNARYCYA
jgi:arylsulfatase A-like enzyme